MILEVKTKRVFGAAGKVHLDILINDQVVSGQCGLTLPGPLLAQFLERLSPDLLDGAEYIPGMPIELAHSR